MNRIKTLFLLIAIATFAFACERESITPDTATAPQLYGTSGLVAPAAPCGSPEFTHLTDISEGNFGSIEFVNDEHNLHVMFTLNTGRFLEELRVFAGDASTIDNDGAGNLIMEDFQFQTNFSTPQSRYTVILPHAALGACTDIVVYGRIATRNQFGQMSDRRYVWADGLSLFNIESYKYCLGTCAVIGGGPNPIH
jgi:hypothetical protein